MQVELRETITVQRSIEDCFRYVQDFSTVEQWDPGVYRSEKLTPGKVRAGSEFDLLLNLAGRHVAIRYTLEQLEKNTLLVLRGRNRTLEALDTIRFTKLNPSCTQIEYRAELTLRVLPQAIKPLTMRSLRRLGRKAVEGLQNALTVPEKISATPFRSRLKDRLLLPAMRDFTERGYLTMPSKGLSQLMDGKTVVITGPTAGLGLAAACELSRLGAKLILIGRGEDRLQAAKQAIRDFSGAGGDSIELFVAELSLLSEVEQAANRIKARHTKIDVLINNAGVLPLRREQTDEGNELTLAVNLLAPMALTLALQPLLKAARGRVINVASGGMYLAGLKLDDLQYTRGTFDGAKAYARAKRALLVMSEHLSKSWQAEGVDFYVMHPGWAATPGVAKSLPGFNKTLAKYLRDARMGADTIVWLAAAAEVDGQTGYFWFDRQRHCTSVIPGTAVGPNEANELQHRVASLITSESAGALG